MAVTRADLQARLQALDEEREQARASLAAVDAALARYAQDLERAREPEENYISQYRRLAGERDHLMGRYGCSVIDNSASHVGVVAGRLAVPRDVERRIVELCRALRQMELDRQDFLRNGGTTVAGATSRLEELRIARVLLAARLVELGGGS